MNRWALKSSRVCTPAGIKEAVVVIQGEVIHSVVECDSPHFEFLHLEMLPDGAKSHESLPNAAAANFWCEDLGDLVIAPGLIDAHVHLNEPGRTEWEGIETGTRAAAAGGITTLIDMPLNSSPVTTTVKALEEKKAAADGKCWVDLGFYGGVVPGNADEIRGLIAAGVRGIKAFLCDSGLDEFPAVGESELREILPMLQATGIPLLAHAELTCDPPDVSDPRSYMQYLASRPDGWEVAAIELLIRLCREFQTPIHIVHLSTMHAFDLICAAKQEGLPLTVETCPQYLYFGAETIKDGQTQFKCAPPLRSEANRQQMGRKMAVKTLDFVDTIGSDHSPCEPKLKQLEEGDFTRAWGGIAGLQLTLPVVWTVAQQFGWSLEQVVDWTSRMPAKIFGIDRRKGQLLGGCHADITVWDPDASFKVDSEQLYHRHSVSPYHGETLKGRVLRTYLRGHEVYRDDKPIEKPSGQLLKRNQ